MHLRAERDAILTALSAANRAAGALHGSVPSLRLSLTGNLLKVTGSDYDLVITANAAVGGDGNGTASLPARLTVDIVRSLAPGAVEFTTGDSDDDDVRISAGRADFTVRTIAGAEILPFDKPEDTVVTIPAEAFAEGLRQVVRAALTDDSRAPQLTGVYMVPRSGGLRMVATDSYRLAIRDLDGLDALDEKSDGILIPARALSEVQRLVDDAETIAFAGHDLHREAGMRIRAL